MAREIDLMQPNGAASPLGAALNDIIQQSAAANAAVGVVSAAVAVAQGAATSAQRAAGRTPMDFGAVGDGVADDTAAVLAGAQWPGTVDWLDRTYLIASPVSA